MELKPRPPGQRVATATAPGAAVDAQKGEASGSHDTHPNSGLAVQAGGSLRGYGGMSDMNKAGLVQMNMLLTGRQLHHTDHAHTTSGHAHTTSSHAHATSDPWPRPRPHRSHTSTQGQDMDGGVRHSQGGPWVHGPPYAPPPRGPPSRRADQLRPERHRDSGDVGRARGDTGGGGVPQVSHSPSDQETHVDPGGRKTGFMVSIKAMGVLAPPGGGPGGAAGTHHGSWRSMWPWWSWRSTDLRIKRC